MADDEDDIMEDVEEVDIIADDDIENETNRVFKFLPREQKIELHNLIRNNWDEIDDYPRVVHIVYTVVESETYSFILCRCGFV